MRIGIDVRYLSHGLVGGVHTYVQHFVPALIAQATSHDIYLYADSKRPFELSDLPERVTVRTLPWRSPLSSLQHDFFMRRQVAADGIDVMHFPANYGLAPRGTRTVLTLHDVINILPWREIVRGHRKAPRTVAMMTYLHLCTRAAVRRADLILTVSRYAGRQIAARVSLPPGRVVPVPHAPTPDLRRITDAATLAAVRQRQGVHGPFVLADALKNPAVLVRAWRLLPDELRAARQMVFFSRRPDPLPVVHEAVAAGEARLLVRPSREDLIALYSMAEAFVFPSWVEGFGIPVLEAMACGAPVIASDRAAIPEVAGDAALLVDAEDGPALAQHLARLFASPALGAHLREAGYVRAAQFSWSNTAKHILASYEQAWRN